MGAKDQEQHGIAAELLVISVLKSHEKKRVKASVPQKLQLWRLSKSQEEKEPVNMSVLQQFSEKKHGFSFQLPDFNLPKFGGRRSGTTPSSSTASRNQLSTETTKGGKCQDGAAFEKSKAQAYNITSTTYYN